MNNLRALIIEDNQKHLNDAKLEAQKFVDSGILASVDFATNFLEAKALMDTNEYGCIVSDVFFPLDSNLPGWDRDIKNRCYDALQDVIEQIEDEKYQNGINDWLHARSMHPTGVLIALMAKEKNVPIILCTDGYHHSHSLEVVNIWARRNEIRLVDAQYAALQEVKDKMREEMGEQERREFLSSGRVKDVLANSKQWTEAIEHAINLAASTNPS